MKYAFAFLIITVLVLAGCQQSPESSMMKTSEGISNEENSKESMIKDDVMMKDEESQTSQSIYAPFTQKDYEQAQMENKIIVLYFYANWCPICRAEEPKAKEAIESLNNQNVIGFRVNYKDDETDDAEIVLAREFGITYQHTKVIIKDSQRILKSPEEWTTERYISEITRVI